MKLRVYLDLSNAVTRRRMAALLRADGEVALVGTAEDADLVVSERVVATAAPGAVAQAGGALTARELEVLRLVDRSGLTRRSQRPRAALTWVFPGMSVRVHEVSGVGPQKRAGSVIRPRRP